MTYLSDEEKLDILWKTLNNTAETSSVNQSLTSKSLYNEQHTTTPQTYAKNIYLSSTSPGQSYPTTPVTLLLATSDPITINSMVADITNPQAFQATNAPVAPLTNTTPITDWMSPAQGINYALQVFAEYTRTITQTYDTSLGFIVPTGGGTIISIKLKSGGSGYINPTVTITGGTGSNVSVSLDENGTITALNVISGGSGYLGLINSLFFSETPENQAVIAGFVINTFTSVPVSFDGDSSVYSQIYEDDELYPWYFDYKTGVLFFPRNVPDNFKISGYIFTGTKNVPVSFGIQSSFQYLIKDMNVNDIIYFQAVGPYKIKLQKLWVDNSITINTNATISSVPNSNPLKITNTTIIETDPPTIVTPPIDVSFANCDCIIECHWDRTYTTPNPYTFIINNITNAPGNSTSTRTYDTTLGQTPPLLTDLLSNQTLSTHGTITTVTTYNLSQNNIVDNGIVYNGSGAYFGPQYIDLINIGDPTDNPGIYWKITKINSSGSINFNYQYSS